MEKFDHFYAVIMAGGGGTRLWPLSRKKNPKQMVSIFGDDTLFQIAIKRLNGLFPPEKIYVVTIAEQAATLSEQAPEIPKENFLIEPFPKGTASVVGLAATQIKRIDPDAVMCILTADHFMKNIKEFQKLLKSAYLAAIEGYLITLGIQPTHPATGYGYIQKGDPIKMFGEKWAFKVKRFIEKPDSSNANFMFSSGGYDWNSGMFIWHVNSIMEEFQLQMPELFSILKDIDSSLEIGNLDQEIHAIWTKIIPQTIDYGIMENARNVIVLPVSELGWFDVGSWESLFDVLESDENGNLQLAENGLFFNSKNSLLYSRSKGKMIVALGVKDLVLVENENVIMICDRKKSQDIKNVVKYLTDHGLEDYL